MAQSKSKSKSKNKSKSKSKSMIECIYLYMYSTCAQSVEEQSRQGTVGIYKIITRQPDCKLVPAVVPDANAFCFCGR